MATNNVTHWRKLHVTDSEGMPCGRLGDMIDDPLANTGLRHATTGSDGSLGEWIDHFLAADDEEPSWDTPRCPVDWAGFAEALTAAQQQIANA